jgi:hypothetical protein
LIARALADAAQFVTRDPDAGALLGAGQAPGDAVLPVGADQCAGRDLGLGPEVVQLPAQVVDQRRALADQPLAVIDEQPHLELGAGQPRDR